MQTLRVEVREQSKGPGVQFSIPMPPVGKPIPQAIVIAKQRYVFQTVLPSGTILYLLAFGGTAPPNTLTIDASRTPLRRTEGAENWRHKPL